MSGRRSYHQKCVCGEEVEMSEEYDFVSSSGMRQLFEEWQKQHEGCLSIFHQVQQFKMARMELIAGPVMHFRDRTVRTSPQSAKRRSRKYKRLDSHPRPGTKVCRQQKKRSE